jgi:large subunit ribosomal protein L9
MNTKVIMNKDFPTLGEEGDIKEVARGYARNFLFPRNIALPYTEYNLKLFESRKDDIAARKEQKRQDALGLREKLEAQTIKIVVPAGANGKLYGAVTSMTCAEELLKLGFEIERKKIEVPGNAIKSVGTYKVVIKLYGNSTAEIPVVVEAAPVKQETAPTHSEERRRRRRGGEQPAQAPAKAPAAEAPAKPTEAPVEETHVVEISEAPAEETPVVESTEAPVEETPAVESAEAPVETPAEETPVAPTESAEVPEAPEAPAESAE